MCGSNRPLIQTPNTETHPPQTCASGFCLPCWTSAALQIGICPITSVIAARGAILVMWCGPTSRARETFESQRRYASPDPAPLAPNLQRPLRKKHNNRCSRSDSEGTPKVCLFQASWPTGLEQPTRVLATDLSAAGHYYERSHQLTREPSLRRPRTEESIQRLWTLCPTSPTPSQRAALEIQPDLPLTHV